MATSLQTTGNFGIQDWQAVYQAFNNPFLASYDFETLRQSMLNYIQQYHPETFNDYTNSSEFIALLDMIAYMGQAMSFRFDLNARETFLSTATTRNGITALANLINYVPSRNIAANGYLKITNISTNQDIYDSLGNNLNSITINWNDPTNKNWLDQWNSIINAALTPSQTIGNPGNTQKINGINYSEYGVSCAVGQLPPYAFSSIIDNSSMNFEVVNPTSVGTAYIHEVDPYNSTSTFNLLFETDGMGYSSSNTGYFLYFKQGSLSSQKFSMTNSLPNSSVTLTATGVNNSDVWLYQVNNDGTYTEWTQVQSIYGDNTNTSTSNIFSITSGVNDTITLVFGDGVFGAIPQGNFICYTRSSNGLTYRINPSEMNNIIISIPYNTKTNRTGTLTIRASLLYTVGNSAATESLANIKIKAPQNYYTQNRMVNGQDYNTFPYTQYSSILQCKAVNRTSSGVSRYLDVIDPTGKYSSTNVFGDDGFLYTDSSIKNSKYSYTSQNNLSSILELQISDIIADSGTLSFIFNNYQPVYPTVQILWNMTLTDNTSCSGWLGNNYASTNIITSVNDTIFSSSLTANTSALVPGAVLAFVPPSGYIFDNNNNLVAGNATIPQLNQKPVAYATIVGTPTNDGFGNSIEQNGVNVDGSGAITLNEKIPNGAILSYIFPYVSSTLPSNVIKNIITAISSNQSVALQYDPYLIGTGVDNCWTITTSPAFPLNYDPNVYGNTFYPPYSPYSTVTTSWLLAFVPNTSSSFSVYQRRNSYFFGSEKQTSFYFDANARIYDPVNSSTLVDRITVLKTNSAPTTSTNIGLSQDIPMDIYDVVTNIDGSIDTTRIGVEYADLNSSGFPSNPTFFTDCVGNNPVANNNYVFFVTDNTTGKTTLIPSVPNSVVVVSTPSTINTNLYTYANGAIIFCVANATFYGISRIGAVASKTTLNNTGDNLTYSYYIGRQDLKFQYIHNASDNRRIDPSPSNIIDLYILEQSYSTAYQQWITDTTGQITEPTPPTTETLSNDFSGLNDYKMVSDQLVFNSAQFVPLFGAKADSSVQANFVVIANPNVVISSGEIASQVITQINNFFAIGNFSFGQTFLWAQLSNYIMTNIGNIISAIHIVPIASNLTYGALEQITCNPYEIFVSAATVQNVQVVTSLSSLNLRMS